MPQKIAKNHTVLILFGTINEGDAYLDACCCFNTPSIHNLAISLMRVFCVFLTLGKLSRGVAFFLYLKGDRLNCPVT
jgi:hypothetical protein